MEKNLEKGKLLRAWHILVNNLSLSAVNELNDNLFFDGIMIDTDDAQNELDFIKACNTVDEWLDQVENDVLDFEDLKNCTEFIKDDQHSKKNLKNLLEEIFDECDEEFDENYVNAIVTVIFE
jgi:hypothetical protein